MTTAPAWEAAARNEALLGLQLLAAIPEWETPLEGGDTAGLLM